MRDINKDDFQIGNEINKRSLNILGIRGLPADHGGFETFASHLAAYMRDNGWKVTVYCQHDRSDKHSPANGSTDIWNGIYRKHISVWGDTAISTVIFDLLCIIDVVKKSGLDLILGYNTAIFIIILKLFRRAVFMNMDGIEWQRKKWGFIAKLWFWINEAIGAHLSDFPIADHPGIRDHLKSRGCSRAVVIPYGADEIQEADESLIKQFDLDQRKYFISVARIEPENSILEIVKAFTATSLQEKLIVLGRYQPQSNKYHAEIARHADARVVFPGPIYEKEIVASLRFFALAYLHGHQVGGTNPSLVEALGAGCAVIARDNIFNRWVTGGDQLYFTNEQECAAIMIRTASDHELVKQLQIAARARHSSAFYWKNILSEYKLLFENAIRISESNSNRKAILENLLTLVSFRKLWVRIRSFYN